MNATKLTMVLLAGLAIAACSGSDTVPAGSSTNVGGSGAGSNAGNAAARTNALGGAGGNAFTPIFPGATREETDLVQNNLTVYFEFDSSEIRAEFNPMLAAHAAYLASDRNVSVRLEGHADERGSREYNIGLGEQRAQAVRQILALQGAGGAQLSADSL
jgi:peptidoglycan-associated lipoprotein